MADTGKFFVYDSIQPALAAGDYRLQGAVTLAAADGTDLPVETLQTHLTVTAPRFGLSPDQVLMTYPPANSEGAFDERLPQIVLRRRSLPWDRKAGPVGTRHHGQIIRAETPWLALVVIAEGEGTISHDQPIADCVTPGVVLDGPADVATTSCLSVPASSVAQLFPTIDDLALLTHVREVNLADTEAAMGDDDGFMAVVIANRMPLFDSAACRARRYTACLISLEGQLGALPPPAPAAPDHYLMTDLYHTDLLRNLAKAPSATLAVPQILAGQARVLDLADADAVTTAFRRGELAVHDGQVFDMLTMTATGPARLGPIDTIALLDSDYAGLARVSGPMARIDNVFDGFRLPLAALTGEKMLRFPLLSAWRFTATGAGSFAGLMQDLDVGLFGTVSEGGYRRPQPPCAPAQGGTAAPPPPATRLPLEVTETGHLALPHLTRLGAQGTGWYRGPCAPWPLLRRPVADQTRPVLAHVSDHLRLVTPDGRSDLSLAVGFETGRLLALAQPSFVAAVMRWRADAYRGAVQTARRRDALQDQLDAFDQDLRDLLAGLPDLRQIAAALGGGLFARLNAGRDGAICGGRDLVLPGARIGALEGNPADLLARGLGLDAALLQKVITTPTAPGLLGELQNAPPGVVARDPVRLGPDLDRQLGQVLDLGLDSLTRAAIGEAAISAGSLKDVPVFTDLAPFLQHNLNRIR